MKKRNTSLYYIYNKYNNRRGEIVTALTLIGLGVLLVGMVVGGKVIQNTSKSQDIRSRAVEPAPAATATPTPPGTCGQCQKATGNPANPCEADLSKNNTTCYVTGVCSGGSCLCKTSSGRACAGDIYLPGQGEGCSCSGKVRINECKYNDDGVSVMGCDGPTITPVANRGNCPANGVCWGAACSTINPINSYTDEPSGKKCGAALNVNCCVPKNSPTPPIRTPTPTAHPPTPPSQRLVCFQRPGASVCTANSGGPDCVNCEYSQRPATGGWVVCSGTCGAGGGESCPDNEKKMNCKGWNAMGVLVCDGTSPCHGSNVCEGVNGATSATCFSCYCTGGGGRWEGSVITKLHIVYHDGSLYGPIVAEQGYDAQCAVNKTQGLSTGLVAVYENNSWRDALRWYLCVSGSPQTPQTMEEFHAIDNTAKQWKVQIIPPPGKTCVWQYKKNWNQAPIAGNGTGCDNIVLDDMPANSDMPVLDISIEDIPTVTTIPNTPTPISVSCKDSLASPSTVVSGNTVTYSPGTQMGGWEARLRYSYQSYGGSDYPNPCSTSPCTITADATKGSSLYFWTNLLKDIGGTQYFCRGVDNAWSNPPGQPEGYSCSNTCKITVAIVTMTPSPTIASNCPLPCAKKSIGDADCNGVIDENDFGIWLWQYQAGETIGRDKRTANFNCVNGDNSTNIVNEADFNIWFANYGRVL